MLTLVTLLAVAVSPGSLAVPPFSGAGLGPAELALAAERLAAGLEAHHQEALGPLRLAELPGRWPPPGRDDCGADDHPCQAAHAAALGVGSLVTGTVSREAGRLRLEVKVVHAGDARVLAAARGEAASPAAVPDAIDQLVLALSVQLDVAPRPAAAASVSPGLGAAFWIPVVAGAVVGGAGAYLLGTALAELDQVRQARGVTLLEPEASLRLEDAIKRRNVGIAGVSLGAASIAYGAIWGRPEVHVVTPMVLRLQVSPERAQVMLAGSF
jgi:hypothetical protein